MVRDTASYDLILDDEQRSSVEDLLFEKTGQRSSVSSRVRLEIAEPFLTFVSNIGARNPIFNTCY